jgi:hypothetical protein
MKKKRFLILVLVVAMAMIGVVMGHRATAEEISLFGKPLNLFGYVTQNASFGVHNKDSYDMEKGLNSALTNFFVEGAYTPLANLKFYMSSMLTVDWAYQLNANRDSWDDKLFPKSRGHLNVDDKYWQILKEAHLTWTPGDFFFRVGKQIVSWGEMDGFRLMDQINPLDQRRGFQDVEFETTIIPIWLLRSEYFPPIRTAWLKDLGFEFVFNPNADFIDDQRILTGNDKGGIWAPNVLANGPFPFGKAHVGSIFENIKNPGHFDSDGFEYAFRVKANVMDTLVTLNYFYGRANSPVLKNSPVAPFITKASDGLLILHPFQEGYYPLFRFIGATLSRDLQFLRIPFLGGISPVLRTEAFYAFDDTFVTLKNRFAKSDEFRWAVGLDWKWIFRFLNPTGGFSLSPQFYHQRIIDEPSGAARFNGIYRDNYAATIGLKTSYFHSRLTPSVFLYYDITNKANFWRLQLIYDHSDNWHFTLGAWLGDGKISGRSFNLFDNKDYIFFKLTYKWG